MDTDNFSHGGLGLRRQSRGAGATPLFNSHPSFSESAVATPLCQRSPKIRLDRLYFVLQSIYMNPNWAEENLQTIRTLMERSALYRRALAPIMLLAGTLGVTAAIVGLLCHLDSIRAFCFLWLGTAVITLMGALVVARQQALKENEVFWSPPTRRVGQALLPPFFVGLCLCVPFIMENPLELTEPMNHLRMLFVTHAWILFYGCAMATAGFFVPRGIKFFGWLFIAGGCTFFFYFSTSETANFDFDAHWLMGFFFGVLHLVYGVYLYLTEKGKNAA